MHAHLLVGLLLALDVPAPSTAVEVEIEGTWVIQRATHWGRAREDRHGVRIVFAGGRYNLGGSDPGTYAVGPPESPRKIDLSEEGRKAPFHSLYRLGRGDCLILCVPDHPGGPRPTRFTAEEGERFELWVLKRAKK